jgi:hypothetical protein
LGSFLKTIRPIVCKHVALFPYSVGIPEFNRNFIKKKEKYRTGIKEGDSYNVAVEPKS